MLLDVHVITRVGTGSLDTDSAFAFADISRENASQQASLKRNTAGIGDISTSVHDPVEREAVEPFVLARHGRKSAQTDFALPMRLVSK